MPPDPRQRHLRHQMTAQQVSHLNVLNALGQLSPDEQFFYAAVLHPELYPLTEKGPYEVLNED